MGRSGGGGSRGGGFSHSSHSSSRSHSSHVGGSSFRSSSTSRPSSSRVSSPSRPSPGGGFRPSGGGFRPTPPPPPPPRPGYGYRPRTTVHVHNNYAGTRSGYARRSSLGTLVGMIIVFVALFMFIGVLASSQTMSNVPQSTVNREPISAGSFTTNCVVDEIGWIREDGSSETKLGGKLEYFWKETGIQPYVVLLENSYEYATADARYDYADALYDQITGGREDAILLVYFDDEPDGVWEMVKGKLTASVMDDEACEILWGFCDRYWYDLNYTVPQAIENTFTKTADSIMRKATTGADVASKGMIVLAVIILVVGVVVIMKTRRKHEAERAEETERILQAGQSQETFGSSDAEMDELTSRYDNMD